MAVTEASITAFAQSWLDREDLEGVTAADLIEMTEDQFKPLRLRNMVKRYTETVDEAIVSLPDDFLQERGLELNGPLQFITADEMQARSDCTGIPEEWTLIDGNIQLWPAPDAAYELSLIYYAKIPPLSEGNFIATDYGSAYRFGVLWAGAMYLQDDRSAQYRAEFDRILGQMQSDLTDRVGRRLRTDLPMCRREGRINPTSGVSPAANYEDDYDAGYG